MRRVNVAGDAIFVDEIGIETGIHGDFRLKSTYQPIFRRELSTLRPAAVEGHMAAFVDGIEVPPGRPLEDADPSDRLFVKGMCRELHLRNHHNIGVADLDLFVRYDPGASRDPKAVARDVAGLARRLGEIELDPRLVVCALGETGELDLSALLVLVGEMHRHGLRVALDDFGGGDATFERIGLLRPDIVKTDGAWFRRLCASQPTSKLFCSIAETIRGFGATVLVDGVETPAQLRVALDARAEFLQGCLLARPALAGTIFDPTPLDIAGLLQADAKVVSLFG